MRWVGVILSQERKVRSPHLSLRRLLTPPLLQSFLELCTTRLHPAWPPTLHWAVTRPPHEASAPQQGSPGNPRPDWDFQNVKVLGNSTGPLDNATLVLGASQEELRRATPL